MRAESHAIEADSDGVALAADLLASALPAELLRHGRFAVVSDSDGMIVAAMPGFENLVDFGLLAARQSLLRADPPLFNVRFGGKNIDAAKEHSSPSGVEAMLA